MADDVRVPAGWYPDPLGLPQLRWWDNHAWTEHTSDARQPRLGQENAAPTAAPRLAYADDDVARPGEMPTRRAMRERERVGYGDTAGLHTKDPSSPPFDEPLRSLEAPARDEARLDEPSPAVRYAMAGLLADVPTSPRYELDERHDDLLGADAAPKSAFARAGDPGPSFVPGAKAAPRRTRAATEIETGTGPAWVLTLIPVYVLVVGMLVLLSGPDASFAPITLGLVFGVPWLAGIGLAIADRSRLRRAGMARPAHWIWALLGAPVYLVARLVATVREAGSGFGPVLTYLVMLLFTGVAVIAVPGLAMEFSPATFSAEAEKSITEDAFSLGAELTVDCPETPPMLVQQTFTCTATNAAGREFPVVVSLQRSNGWIDWRVDDWGVFSLD